MKIAFYCPLKPINHPNASGDREIARGLHRFFQGKDAEIFVLSEFRTRLFYQEFGRVIEWLLCLWRAYLLARREKPDLFFTYHSYYKAPDAIGFLLAWWFGKPYVVFEGMYARRSARRWGFWSGYWLNRGALAYASHIFTDKTEDHEFLREWFSAEKVHYLPPSVDVNAIQAARPAREKWRATLGIAPAELLIVTVAMLRADRKTEGVKFLIRCLQGLESEGTSFRWVHVGGGVCLEETRKYAADLIGARGQLLGAMEASQVAEVLNAGDLFAFPGLDEGFGLVFVEAQSASLPVVAFRNGGIPDAVDDGRSAFLTPVLDMAAYSDALRRLLTERGLREKMGQDAERYARTKFDRQKNYEVLWSTLARLPRLTK